MKKILFGLAVAVVALGTSAFINAKPNKTFSAAYIIDFDPTTQEYIFSLADPGPAICPNTTYPLPCGITPISYSLPIGTDRLAKSLIDNQFLTIWDTTRDGY